MIKGTTGVFFQIELFALHTLKIKFGPTLLSFIFIPQYLQIYNWSNPFSKNFEMSFLQQFQVRWTFDNFYYDSPYFLGKYYRYTSCWKIPHCPFKTCIVNWIAWGWEAHFRNYRHFVSQCPVSTLDWQFPSQGMGWPRRRFIHLPSESPWAGIKPRSPV